MDTVGTRSGLGLASDIRAGRRSSRDVVEAHIARIEATQERVRAVVADRFEAARAEADAADRAVREGRPEADRPFWGVPCTVKESIAVQGMPWTAGLLARRHLRASADAPVVARLRGAGAIVLGVTNTSELCMWMESDNPIYGRTNNAYDPARIAGGSSGGEGAIVGVGGSPIGLGADVGGSIRMPAFFNGVFGHKATPGLIPNAGQYPTSDGPLLATGPLVRRAEDLPALVSVLAGPHPDCSRAVPMPLGDPATVRLDGLPVIAVPQIGRITVEETLAASIRGATATLAGQGARLRTETFPRMAGALEMWAAAMGEAEGPGAYRKLLGTSRRALLRQLLRREPAHHTLPSLLLGLVEDLPDLLPSTAAKALRELATLRAELIEAMGDGVLLIAPYPEPAPPHTWPQYRPWRWVYTALFNALGFPVTAAPLGLSPEGLPLGVQIVARPGHDHVTMAVALALEAAHGGWTPPADLRG
jgi:fatty acid amide hydrolase 2